MKMMLAGMAALGAGGVAVTGAMDGHDVQRTVAKPPEAVYAAMSAVLPEGEQAGPIGEELGQFRLRVKKETADPSNTRSC